MPASEDKKYGASDDGTIDDLRRMNDDDPSRSSGDGEPPAILVDVPPPILRAAPEIETAIPASPNVPPAPTGGSTGPIYTTFPGTDGSPRPAGVSPAVETARPTDRPAGATPAPATGTLDAFLSSPTARAISLGIAAISLWWLIFGKRED